MAQRSWSTRRLLLDHVNCVHDRQAERDFLVCWAVLNCPWLSVWKLLIAMQSNMYIRTQSELE